VAQQRDGDRECQRVCVLGGGEEVGRKGLLFLKKKKQKDFMNLHQG
jgi:hypothetical protein